MGLFSSVALTLCLCIFSQSVAHAYLEIPSQPEDVLTVESEDVPDTSDDVITGQPEIPSQPEGVLTYEYTAGLDTRDSTIPTPTEVYKAMIALKDQDAYKEGTPWTNDVPYSDSTGYYHWKGGTLDGKNISAVGCVAFAFILSDAAFGSLRAGFIFE